MKYVHNSILGCLYGQALGDAFAMPAHVHPDDTERAFGWLESWQAAPDDHVVHAGLPAGRITDDSEQAFSIARAVIEAGGVTLEAAVDGLTAWYDRVDGPNSPYVGPSTRRGMNALKRGEDPRTTGLWGDTNGAPMRIAPIGLLHPGDIEGAAADAAIVCMPTHFTQPAVSGAAAVAAAVAGAIVVGATLDSAISAGLRGAELGAKQGRRWFGCSVPFKIEQALKIANSGSDVRVNLRRLFDEVGATLNVPETVGAAFGLLAMAGGDPKHTAILAANLSGDADTIGAIACAMAGAFAGFDAIPAEDVAVLENDEIFQAYKVREIAAGLRRMIEAR
ncbi:MAG: ADP-ribosylglycohydrolase family protein [Chloroflexota bacterium]|nr:ADP-ribosylglycohydrolase family protein [Chloroflexota bacterium]MDE2911238.1 ADP-ribosylglycohydrolase family protein [Chloroflexota bacterium]